ncbi:MAG: F0F1 ATP synthase subunit B [Gammaproteobacteria bacterium]|jgi:F-type H+-transporting ATPase subunit b
MQIDWITVSAQIVNFLILVWLLKRFLYQPVLRAMGRREEHIADRLNQANDREQQAQQQREQYQNKQKELDQQHDEILAKANEEADQEKHRLLDEARSEVENKKHHWQQQLAQEKEEFLKSLRDQAGDIIQHMTRKALSDLANGTLEQHMVESFIDRLESLDDDTRRALANTQETIQVNTSFELDSGMRSQLTQTIHENIGNGIDVQYDQLPELVCGIELVTGGQQLSWNINHYLDDLTARIEQAFAGANISQET